MFKEINLKRLIKRLRSIFLQIMRARIFFFIRTVAITKKWNQRLSWELLLLIFFQNWCNRVWRIYLFVFLNQLLRLNLNFHCYTATFVRKFQRVWKKIEQNLKKPILISMYGLYEIQVCFLVYYGSELYAFFVRTKCEHLKSLIYNIWKAEVILGQLEWIILHLGKIKQIIYQVFHHLLRKYLSL
jgi:hypothetical protein